MQWNKHFDLEGKHAFLSPSKSTWLRYDFDKLEEVKTNTEAKERGTRLHAFASEAIKLKQNLPKTKKTLNMFVNDAIGYGMESEQPLYYSRFCFGTADAISFRRKKLRIHDYKSGSGKVSMDQLMCYAALFCLEYKIKPGEMEDCELRIYQNDDIIVHKPTVDEIVAVMDIIVSFTNYLTIRDEEGM